MSTTNPLDRLNAKIRKYQKLRELLEDPEMVEICKEILGVNGLKPPQPAKIQLKTHMPRPHSNNLKTQRGELESVAKKVIPNLTATFNNRDLIRAVKASGYVFAAKNEGIAISGVLKRLVKKGVLRRLDTQGSRRNALYGHAA